MSNTLETYRRHNRERITNRKIAVCAFARVMDSKKMFAKRPSMRNVVVGSASKTAITSARKSKEIIASSALPPCRDLQNLKL